MPDAKIGVIGGKVHFYCKNKNGRDNSPVISP
jgi:hypothetical protein